MALTEDKVIISNSITRLPSDPKGKVFVTGSHGGVYPGYLAAKLGVRAAVFNDAGLCKNSSAIGGLYYLEKIGIAAIAVSNMSAEIGNVKDVYENGIVSYMNRPAENVGCKVGMTCAEAVEKLTSAPLVGGNIVPSQENRHEIRSKYPRIVCMDSVSLVEDGDWDAIVISGSHGALLGGSKPTALKHDAIAAFYNDAGFGKNNIAVTRLPALDERGIIAGTVDSATAEIGNGLSTYEDGVLSCVNKCAEDAGARVGMRLKDFVAMLCERLEKK